jgi:6-phosphogluconolactonase
VSQRLAQLSTFDVVMLGMGDDGHFASLFPDSEAVGSAMDPQGERQCVAVTPPLAPHRRMSLSLARLLDCRQLILHITGDDKREVLAQAQRDGDPLALPIAAVLASRDPEVELYWAP